MDIITAPAKPTLKEKIGYGFGDMSSSMFWKIFSYYLPIFYSDVFGLKPQHAAFLLLITKLYDAISDPVMGIIADRTRSRWGKYRPYLLWVALPFSLIGLLSFYTPDASYGLKHVYAYVMYILMMTVYTAINVPYGAMLGVITPDSREKSVFSSYRMFFAYIGSFIAMGIFGVFEKLISGTVRVMPDGSERVVRGVGDAAPGQWTLVVGIVSLCCFVLFLLCFLMTRERVGTEHKPASEGGSSIAEDLKALGRNRPWWLLLGAGIGILLFNSIRGGAAAYYFSNILGTSVFLTCAVYLFIGEVAQMVGVLFTVPLSERIGKKATFISVLLTVSVLSVAIFFLPETPAGFWGLLVLQVLICIAFGVQSPLLWSMFADVADYSEEKNGSSSTGLIFSSSSMAQKFGGALGAFLLMQILAIFAYDKDAAVQAPQTLAAIRGLMSYIPAIGALLGALCLLFYPLTESRMASIRENLSARR
ncbi:MAG: MFS transporter [Bacteroidales bacterium]|nr:MFS transporter [Bacteroidales bacterium]